MKILHKNLTDLDSSLANVMTSVTSVLSYIGIISKPPVKFILLYKEKDVLQNTLMVGTNLTKLFYYNFSNGSCWRDNDYNQQLS